MANMFKLKGRFIGDNERGKVISGTLFLPGKVREVSVTQDVLNKLLLAEENGWFEVIEHEGVVDGGPQAPDAPVYVAYTETEKTKLAATPKITVSTEDADVEAMVEGEIWMKREA